MTVSDSHAARIESVFRELRIPPELVTERGLCLFDEACDLVVAEVGDDGREYLLTPAAAEAWRRMREAASSDGVTLRIASAFRSVDRQVELIRRKLDRGLSIEEILAVSAPPGYSEHHSGRAVDVDTPGSAPLEAEFEHTAAFRWLTRNAASFHFEMSFPSGNPYGYVYEPWHWCFRSPEAKVI